MRKTDLNGEWRLYISDGPREARREAELADITPLTALIPETLEATLERLGILPGLFVGDNVLKAQEYETKHLWYVKNFDCVPADGVPTLRFDGVDTVAEIFLNGVKLGGTDIQVRTSGYARFADAEIDKDVLAGTATVDVTGILTCYLSSGTYVAQFTLIDEDSVTVNK